MAKIQSYYTSKNVQFVNHDNLDPWKIDMILYASFPFVILYQNQYFVKPDRLNYGTIN